MHNKPNDQVTGALETIGPDQICSFLAVATSQGLTLLSLNSCSVDLGVGELFQDI